MTSAEIHTIFFLVSPSYPNTGQHLTESPHILGDVLSGYTESITQRNACVGNLQPVFTVVIAPVLKAAGI